jgi:hypothetical protein
VRDEAHRNFLKMHVVSPTVAETQVSSIAAEVFPRKIDVLSPPGQLLLPWLLEPLPDSLDIEKKVQS